MAATVSCAEHAVEIMMNPQPVVEGMQKYRAPSLFQPHLARQALRDAFDGKIQPLSGLYLGLSDLPTARFIAPMGFDVVWIDWEHTSCNVETMTSMVHEIMFMSEGRTMPFVRVPGHDHAAIGYALDCGASLVIPQVDTVEQAKHVCSAAKFGKKRNGTRSAPPFRLIPGLTDAVHQSPFTKYAEQGPPIDIWHAVNNQAAIMIQIETLEGINNLDAILTECPEIDAVWLGTLDARVSMDLPGNGGMGGQEPEWMTAVGRYIEVTEKHRVARGGFALGNDEMFEMMSSKLHFVVGASEVLALMQLHHDLTRMRKLMAKRVKSAEGAVPLPVSNGSSVANGTAEGA